MASDNFATRVEKKFLGKCKDGDIGRKTLVEFQPGITEPSCTPECWFRGIAERTFVEIKPGIYEFSCTAEGWIRGNRFERVADYFNFVPEYVKISAGKFTMGASDNTANVEISRDFDIGKYEVTQYEWFAVMGNNPSYFKLFSYCRQDYIAIKLADKPAVELCPYNPVDSVSWDDTQIFISTLNYNDNLTGCHGIPSDPRGCYRLPTDAEWEYAARGGTTTTYFWGNRLNNYVGGNYAWYYLNSSVDGIYQTHKVGTKTPNNWGLHDTTGNVSEWVQDAYNRKLLRGRYPLVNDSYYRVYRGGNYYSNPSDITSADRYSGSPIARHKDMGFRLARARYTALPYLAN